MTGDPASHESLAEAGIGRALPKLMAIPSKAASGIPQEHNPALIIATNLLVPSGNDDEETSQAPIMGKQSRRLWTKLFESKETMRLFFGSLKGFLENPAMVERASYARGSNRCVS